jgi:hypothetical protein
VALPSELATLVEDLARDWETLADEERDDFLEWLKRAKPR